MTENLIEGPATTGTATAAVDSAPISADDDLLLGSLGLANVEADPNKIPDGTYDGQIVSAEKVVIESKNKVSAVITFVVTSGDKKDARKPRFYDLGINPQFDENGNLLSFTPTMTDKNKQYFKKAFTDAGIPEQAVNEGRVKLAHLVGREVTFGVKTTDGFQNVNWWQPRGNSLPQTQPTMQVPTSVIPEPAQNGDLPPF